MTDYRAYSVGPDGHFSSSEIITADTDEEAVAAAGLLVTDEISIEVWDLDRKVAVLPKNSAA